MEERIQGQRGSVTWSFFALAVSSCGSECLWSERVSRWWKAQSAKRGNSRELPASTGPPAVCGRSGGVITAYLLPCEGSRVSDSSSRAGRPGSPGVIGACIASVQFPEPGQTTGPEACCL